jgi:hypothetical protein
MQRRYGPALLIAVGSLILIIGLFLDLTVRLVGSTMVVVGVILASLAYLVRRQDQQVAEVAALLSIPLGVARVVVGDMVVLNLVTVHQTASSAGGNTPDLALMERVLSGLRRL